VGEQAGWLAPGGDAELVPDGQYNGVFTGYHCGMVPMVRKPLGTVGGGRGPEAGETAADVRWCGKEERQ
jgi:hypothetical protein